MKALFIRRMHRSRKDRNPLYRIYRDYHRFYKPGGHRWSFKGQNGFFRASLACEYRVKTVRIQKAAKNITHYLKEYDLIVCDSKAFMDNKHRQVEPVDFFKKKGPAVRALLLANARPDIMLPDEILDHFDIIFKREPFKDRDRYNISNRNKDRIRATMLGCPLIPATPRNVKKLNPAELGFKHPQQEFTHDVFFSGINTAKVREEYVERLSGEAFEFYGGLQFRKRAASISQRHAFPRLGKKKYIDAIRRSRTGLVLEGEGPFTYRHLEMWFLCSFLISTPAIRDLELPINPVENEHFVCYKDYEDLIDKINYYLNNEHERKEIAVKGRRMFENNYSYKDHGKYIRECTESLR